MTDLETKHRFVMVKEMQSDFCWVTWERVDSSFFFENPFSGECGVQVSGGELEQPLGKN